MAGVAKEPVAFFDVFERASAEEEFQVQGGPLFIYPNWEFYIGRSPECAYICGDPAVSNKHIHVTCIIFDEDTSVNNIPPLVYVQDFSTNGTYLKRPTSDPASAVEQLLSRRDGKILLGAGDQIRISPAIAFRFRYSGTVDPNFDRLPAAQRREAELFADRYTITNQVLGSGGYGNVFAAIHKKSNRQLACKVVDLSLVSKEQPRRDPLHDVTNERNGSPVARMKKDRAHRDSILNSQQFREFDILQHLDHPNIVHLEKVFWSDWTIFIFQELITSGDLFSYIAYSQERLPDADVAVILLQVLKGVEHLHDRDIVHRDLKPDNILISASSDAPIRVIITDFGSCRRIEAEEPKDNVPDTPKQRMHTFSGTLEYIAPEIYNTSKSTSKGYTKAVDMWSIGIISTMLLTRDVIFRANNLPIPGQDPKKVMAKLTANCDLRILDSPGSAWRSVGKRPKDFVRHLLVVDEAKRLDVKQALAHPWFTNKYCREGFDTVYKKAIAGWQPRHKAYRVVEALDLSKLKPILNKQRTDDQARSRFFMDFSCPFPQGDLYSGSIRSSGKAVPELLPTIGEEATPEPETPLRDPLDAPLAPRSKKPPQAISVHDVDYSLGHIDVDSNVPASKAITDTNMTDRDQEMEYDSFDLDAPVRRSPVPQMRVPPQMTTQTKEIVQETPPKHLKRPYEPEPDLEDTYNSSIEIMGEYVSTGAKFAKKFRVLR